MKYTEFRDAIHQGLQANPGGYTWVQLREHLQLPYDQPCPTWVARLEAEIGLERKERLRGAYIWKLKPPKE
jgi:hypothetical protein